MEKKVLFDLLMWFRENVEKKLLFDFFIWFRENGQKYINISIEKMIDKFLEEHKTGLDGNI